MGAAAPEFFFSVCSAGASQDLSDAESELGKERCIRWDQNNLKGSINACVFILIKTIYKCLSWALGEESGMNPMVVLKNIRRLLVLNECEVE